MKCSENARWTDSSTYEIDRDNSMVICRYNCDSRNIEAPLLPTFSRDLIFWINRGTHSKAHSGEWVVVIFKSTRQICTVNVV